MSCSELVELVTDYLEGRLAPDEAERFEAHLGVCPPCGVYLDQMRATLTALGRIPEESISTEARDELLHAFATLRTD
jgi:anti-sigma factor RsiW